MAWRGTVPESEATAAAQKAFVETFTFFHAPGTQILSYVILGENGSLEPGKRLINWVWYCNRPEDSNEFKELLIDSDGKHHHITLPIGKMKKEVLEGQREEGLTTSIRGYRLRYETAFHSSNYRCHLAAEFVLRWQVAVDWRCFGGFPTSYSC